MATTYEAIATVEVGSGGAADIEFTSIPGTYTDLVVKVSARSTSSSGDCRIELNGSCELTTVEYCFTEMALPLHRQAILVSIYVLGCRCYQPFNYYK
jgi:hypothetical protein